jgi:hypothetical protein
LKGWPPASYIPIPGDITSHKMEFSISYWFQPWFQNYFFLLISKLITQRSATTTGNVRERQWRRLHLSCRFLLQICRSTIPETRSPHVCYGHSHYQTVLMPLHASNYTILIIFGFEWSTAFSCCVVLDKLPAAVPTHIDMIPPCCQQVVMH